MSIMTNMTFISKNEMHTISFVKKYNLSIYKGTLSPYHLKCTYFIFDKNKDMGSCLSLSYQGMENVFQELDAVVKDESTSIPFAIFLQMWNFMQKNQ